MEKSKPSKYAQQLFDIYKRAGTLPQINVAMREFINLLYTDFNTDAETYYQLREKFNNSLGGPIKQMVSKLELLFSQSNIKVEIIQTSSIIAGINLINDSDCDLSILVDDLDNNLGIITSMLTKAGFTYDQIVNPNQPKNLYHSFSLQTDIIEFELKVRDKIASKVICELHHYMASNLTNSERIIITYGKYYFKNLTKTSKNDIDKMSYALFKKLIYEMFFYYIDGGFLLELIYS